VPQHRQDAKPDDRQGDDAENFLLLRLDPSAELEPCEPQEAKRPSGQTPARTTPGRKRGNCGGLKLLSSSRSIFFAWLAFQ